VVNGICQRHEPLCIASAKLQQHSTGRIYRQHRSSHRQRPLAALGTGVTAVYVQQSMAGTILGQDQTQCTTQFKSAPYMQWQRLLVVLYCRYPKTNELGSTLFAATICSGMQDTSTRYAQQRDSTQSESESERVCVGMAYFLPCLSRVWRSALASISVRRIWRLPLLRCAIIS
jgi:hypothetical protein